MKSLRCSAFALVMIASQVMAATPVDQVLESENRNFGVTLEAQPLVDDMAYLRRVSIDIVGRIPTSVEIDEYMSWPADGRR